jgi:hypothetical protein
MFVSGSLTGRNVLSPTGFQMGLFQVTAGFT